MPLNFHQPIELRRRKNDGALMVLLNDFREMVVREAKPLSRLDRFAFFLSLFLVCITAALVALAVVYGAALLWAHRINILT